MKKIISAILLFCFTASFANALNINIAQVRDLYERSVKDENACKELIRLLESCDEKEPVLYGYKGCATMVMAKHVFNPFSKLSYFKKGKQMLEKAIAADNANVELRFLRFAAQTNMPSFLGYNSSIEKDKTVILHSYSQIGDMELKRIMLSVLNKSKYITGDEKQKLK